MVFFFTKWIRIYIFAFEFLNLVIGFCMDKIS